MSNSSAVLMENSATSRHDEAMSLLREQDSLYARLEGLATRQRLLVHRAETHPLLQVLAERQRLSAELMQITSRLEPVRSRWSSFREGFRLDQREEADQLLSKTGERLRRVLEGDEQDARLLMIRRKAVAQELHASHTSGEALRAYQSPVEPSARLDGWDEERA
ncbi:MAG: hypothetical protein AABZ47_05510 [Planctomycetota bacterium]